MRVYIAHPAFDDDQRAFKKALMAALNRQLARLAHCETITLVDPFEHAPDVEGNAEEKVARAREIRERCLELLEKCSLVVAVVDGNDTGTAFEAGYAYHMDIPVVLVSEQSCDGANAMLLGAAHARFDNILDPLQISLLAGLIEWHYLRLRGPRLVPTA